MQLGFVSAILPDLSFEQVFQTASKIGFDCVEVCCWPVGKAERRYAGVSHIDTAALDAAAAARIHEVTERTGVAISGLGYYPNPLSPVPGESEAAVSHLETVIRAAHALGLTRVNTFIGRDWTKSIADNWPRMLQVWQPLVGLAEQLGVQIGIENCPMLFTADEWPGGKNLAISPAVWTQLFHDVGSANLGLNYDPSHMIWQQMDYLGPLREFSSRLFHIHAKDVRLDRERLNRVGILAHPNQYHTPKLPGMG
ncbi:MAG: sugar phosphate isomerase/epimerase family protein, partial [Planctomycetaceae bacterium]